jgi:hypothetical protein
MAKEIAGLPSETRNTIVGFLTHLAAGSWLAALIETIKNMAAQ